MIDFLWTWHFVLSMIGGGEHQLSLSTILTLLTFIITLLTAAGAVIWQLGRKFDEAESKRKESQRRLESNVKDMLKERIDPVLQKVAEIDRNVLDVVRRQGAMAERQKIHSEDIDRLKEKVNVGG